MKLNLRLLLWLTICASLSCCNGEDECDPTTFEHGIPDDGLFYGTWRWCRSEVWEYDNDPNDKFLIETILPGASTFESVNICIGEELYINENGLSESYCITKWKSGLTHVPSDPIDNRVLQLTYLSDGIPIIIGFGIYDLNNDTLIAGLYPFESDEYLSPGFNGYINNFFIRTD